MIQAVDLHRDLAGLPLLKERYGHPTDEESLKSFATLAAYRDGGIFATHFRGSSGWERHPQGDEVVQILEGATRFDISSMRSCSPWSSQQACWWLFLRGVGIDSNPRPA